MDKAGWQQMMQQFVAGQISAPEFERRFLEKSRVAVEAGERVPYAVDLMFYEVDAYCADPALRSADDNDDEMLRRHAERLLTRMDEAWPRLPGAPTDEQVLENFRRAVKRLGLTRN